jgi:hypothetical protein
MIPVIIEDLIRNVTDESQSTDKRQFYYVTLKEIEKDISNAIAKYDKKHPGHR